MRICLFGLGYIGTVNAACLAGPLGHTVVGVDVSASRVSTINAGRSPFAFEARTDELIAAAVKEGRLRATTDPLEALSDPDLDVIIVCVSAPPRHPLGYTVALSPSPIDTSCLEDTIRSIRRGLVARLDTTKDSAKLPIPVLNRCTCAPNDHARLTQLLLREPVDDSTPTDVDPVPLTAYVCHPEFLREGNSVSDFLDAPRLVFGYDQGAPAVLHTRDVCVSLSAGLPGQQFFMSIGDASVVKLADNWFHALKVTFANEVGGICHAWRLNGARVMECLAADPVLNCSRAYLRPGLPFGGSCLPKDVACMRDAVCVGDESGEAAATGAALQPPRFLLTGVVDSNQAQMRRIVVRAGASLSAERPRMLFVGIAFKCGTSDLRGSPLVELALETLAAYPHARLALFDACVAPAELPAALSSDSERVTYHTSINDMPEDGAVALIGHKLSHNDALALVSRLAHCRLVLDFVNQRELHDLDGYDGAYWN